MGHNQINPNKYISNLSEMHDVMSNIKYATRRTDMTSPYDLRFSPFFQRKNGNDTNVLWHMGRFYNNRGMSVNILPATITDNREYIVITRLLGNCGVIKEWKKFSMWSVPRNYKSFQNNREVLRSWEVVNRGYEAVMEMCSTEFSWENWTRVFVGRT
jgi:hypothetical protein